MDVTKTITSIATKMNMSPDAVFDMFVKQARIKGFVALLWCALGIFLLYLAWKNLPRYITKLSDVYRQYDADEITMDQKTNQVNTLGTYIALYCCAIVFGIGMVLVNYNTMLAGFFNPNWVILNKLIGDFVQLQ